jgi:hypothetical protein
LVKKIDTLNGLLEDSKVSLGFITETWFNNDNNSVMRSLISKEYHALSAFRSGRGGGALLLVAKKYASKCSPLEPVYPELPVWIPTSFAPREEPLAIDIKMAKLEVHQLPRGYSHVLAVCVYLAEFSSEPARQRQAVWKITGAIERAATCSQGSKPLIIVAGDFNGANVSPLCSTLQLYKITTEATHKRGRVLDLVLTNAPKCYTAELWDPMEKSDHKVIYTYASRASYMTTLTSTSRMVRSGKIVDTVSRLRNTNWTACVTKHALTHPQLATSMFYETIKAAEDAAQPLRRLKVKNDQPWMTRSIKLLIKKRQKCFADGNREEYTEVANLVKREIYYRKRVYYRRKISSKRLNPWWIINSHREQQQ